MNPKICTGLIALTPGQRALARVVGIRRNLSSKNMGITHHAYRLGSNEVVGLAHREGFFGISGEIACALIQDVPLPKKLYWRTEQERREMRKDGDLYGHEIRTATPGNRCLLLHEPERDPPDRPYILIQAISKVVYRVVGWCYGYEAQQEQFWRTRMRHPCFLYPPELLHPGSSRKESRAYWDCVLAERGIVVQKYSCGKE